MNLPEQETRPVLGPAGNKARSVVELHKAKAEKMQKPSVIDEHKGKKSPVSTAAAALLPKEKVSPVGLRKNVGRATSILTANLSMNASCSSDASTDSSHSRASTGGISRRSAPPSRRKQQCSPRGVKVERIEGDGKMVGSDCEGLVAVDGGVSKKRCAWVTSNTGNAADSKDLVIYELCGVDYMLS